MIPPQLLGLAWLTQSGSPISLPIILKMVGAITNYQKPLASRKIKRRQAGEGAMREIRKLKKNSEHFVNKVPYKHLLREFSSNMSTWATI